MTAVGCRRARRPGPHFVDGDSEIERVASAPIRDFFPQQGETPFRDVEQNDIEELTSRPGTLLATGGGAVLRPSSRDALHSDLWQAMPYDDLENCGGMDANHARST